MVAPQNTEPTPTFFSNPEEGLAVVDTSSLIVTIIIKGIELPGMITDRGFGVNVISRWTSDTLGI